MVAVRTFLTSKTLWTLPVILLTISSSHAQDGNDDLQPIRDNSFLVEEAFNQEPGIVQNIFNFIPSWERDRGHSNNFQFVYTQEWPIFSEKHQFSYTVPMLFTSERGPYGQMSDAQSFGDMFLNYRYQLLEGKEGGWWASPRFSLILPTGDAENGFGRDRLGYQVNLPFSREFETMAIHFNAGSTYTPGVTVGIDPLLGPVLGRDLHGYNLGASVVYFLQPHFNLMLESVAVWDEGINRDSTREQTFQFLLNPGFRWAPYTEGDSQWVVGAAVPIGLSRDAPDISLFLYMSFEGRFLKKAKDLFPENGNKAAE